MRRLAPVRRGTTYLEVQIAFTTLGLALAGFAPVIVAGQRIMSRVERQAPPATNAYIVPAGAAWSRKLGASASLAATDPGAYATGRSATRANDVSILPGTLSRSSADDRAEVSVQVKARPEDEP